MSLAKVIKILVKFEKNNSQKGHEIELWGGITPGKSLIPTFYLARWSGLVNWTKCKKQKQNSSRITKVIFEKPGAHKTKMKVPKR